jgi:hypothetical protein
MSRFSESGSKAWFDPASNASVDCNYFGAMRVTALI